MPIDPQVLNLYNDFSYLTFFTHNYGDTLIPAESKENRRFPVIDEMTQWQASIMKFAVPLTNIPLNVFRDNGIELNINPGDPGYISDYWVGFSLGSTDTNVIKQNVIFTPTNNIPLSKIQSRFFYSYSQFTSMVNTALKALWAIALGNAAYNAFTSDNDDNSYPYLEFVDTSSYFQFVLPAGTVASGIAQSPFRNAEGNDGINILMSSKLFTFYSGFPVRFFYGSAGVNASNPELNVSLRMNVTQTNLIELLSENLDKAVPIVDSERWVNKVVQDYTALYLWQAVDRLLFVSSIPSIPEDFAVANPDNPGQVYRQIILTDFDIPPDRFSNQRDILFYYAEGTPRYFNFSGSGPLKLMDIKVYFQTNDLEIYEVLLSPNEDFLIKLQFRRRLNRNLLEY
jgi:hypothetical protein